MAVPKKKKSFSWKAYKKYKIIKKLRTIKNKNKLFFNSVPQFSFLF